ncbi:hypothetical protein Ae356Ps1_5338 [Pseudonocardia sp. Ae356_Ps1]|nr:hypothetical protein Ae356Ps1_5338 [Pseudonocardia sp. Ae356_Ps1]
MIHPLLGCDAHPEITGALTATLSGSDFQAGVGESVQRLVIPVNR